MFLSDSLDIATFGRVRGSNPCAFARTQKKSCNPLLLLAVIDESLTVGIFVRENGKGRWCR